MNCNHRLMHQQVDKQNFYLSSFQVCEPKYKASQVDILNFLVKTHQSALDSQSALDADKVSIQADVPIEKLITRYGVKESQIQFRSFESPDLYQKGKIADDDIKQKTEFFADRAEEIFNELFAKETAQPQHLIHVTCTGYISPSAPQRLVAKKGWDTEVTHAYHMGCYAALPAIRLAWGLAHQDKKIDLVHTEMCSLHFDPSVHVPEQLIVQTLFSDGHIRYQVSRQKTGPSFLIHTIKEKILPDSANDMTWMPGPSHMLMTLSREIPKKIETHIRDFVMNLIESLNPALGLDLSSIMKSATFAVHPGGPKIIEAVAKALELRETQIQQSKEILLERGNMSSATLPHIWHRILQGKPKSGQLVISLAFGPGLTLFGAVFEVNE